MKQRALIDIALILDTRYGILSRMDEEAADKFVASVVYRERDNDNFETLSEGVFKQEQYDKLDAEKSVETLAFSKMSDFLHELRQDVKSAIGKMERGVLIDSLEFHINVWPYELHEEEMEVIRRAVSSWLPPHAQISMVNINPEMLTPEVLDNNYEMMAWYNHEDWLKHHVDALVKKPIPTLVLLTPQIASSAEVPAPTPEIQNPFLCRSAVLVEFIALVYLPTFHTCYNPLIHQLARNLQHSIDAHPDGPRRVSTELEEEPAPESDGLYVRLPG